MDIKEILNSTVNFSDVYSKDKDGLIWDELNNLNKLTGCATNSYKQMNELRPLSNIAAVYKNEIQNDNKEAHISLQSRAGYSLVSTLCEMYKSKDTDMDEFIKHIKTLDTFISRQLIEKVECNLNQLIENREYRLASREEDKIKSLNLLRCILTDVIDAVKIMSDEDADFDNHVDKVGVLPSAEWIKLSDVPLNCGAKFKAFKYIGVAIIKNENGTSAIDLNMEVPIKSAKNLTVEAMRVLQKAVGCKLLDEDILKKIEISNTLKPSASPDGKKAPYEIDKGIYIETGLMWSRRIDMIKKLYKAYGLNINNIWVQLADSDYGEAITNGQVQ